MSEQVSMTTRGPLYSGPITVYEMSIEYNEVSEWLKVNDHSTNPEFEALVIEWASHWHDNWSIEFSKQQHDRIEIIGDWIEEHGGKREWATSMTPLEDIY